MPKRFILILVMVLLSMILYIDRSVISTAKEDITTELGLTEYQIGLVFSIFGFAYALGQTPGGWLADRIGGRITLTLVIMIWSVFTALTGVVRTFWTMLGVRFLFGLGEAGAYPAMARGIYSWLPKSERGLVTASTTDVAKAVTAAIAPATTTWVPCLINGPFQYH